MKNKLYAEVDLWDQLKLALPYNHDQHKELLWSFKLEAYSIDGGKVEIQLMQWSEWFMFMLLSNKRHLIVTAGIVHM